MNKYETDFYEWTKIQSENLRNKRYELLDIDHLIEEIEDLGNRHQDEIDGHVLTIVVHMLKIKYSKESELHYNYNGWLSTIENAQRHLWVVFKNHPSLKKYYIQNIKSLTELAFENAHTLEYLNKFNEDITHWTPEIISGMSMDKIRGK